jgi:hypothetical protein
MLSSSSAPDPSATVIRAGSDGRLRFDPAHREALLDAFERGGTSAMAFARDHGVKYPTFIAWLNKRRARREETAGAVDRPAFAEVLLESSARLSTSAPLRVLLPCGSIVEIGHRAALPLAVELLASLRRPC